MAPSNVVSRPPQGIPKCRSPGPPAPVGAKFQLVGPMKERAPLAQCDTDSKFSGIESKSCSCSWSGAARVPQRPVVCWWQNCQVKRSRGVGKSESPGLEKELCTRRLSLPRPETCLQSAAGVGAASTGMKPLRPRQVSWSGGPAGDKGTLQAGEAAFPSPVTGNPAGAPGGTRCPPPGIRFRAPAARLFANRCTRIECSEIYMCNRQVH